MLSIILQWSVCGHSSNTYMYMSVYSSLPLHVYTCTSTILCIIHTCALYMYVQYVQYMYMHIFRWLLHDPKMILRSNYAPYAKAVKQYFRQLFQILVPLQSAYGGPIIGFQVENEYAYWTNDTTSGRSHLQFLHKVCHYTVCKMYAYRVHIQCMYMYMYV